MFIQRSLIALHNAQMASNYEQYDKDFKEVREIQKRILAAY